MSSLVVADASALVDLLIGGPAVPWIEEQLSDHDAVAPGHVRAEILSALGRRYRGGVLGPVQVEAAVTRTSRIPIVEKPLADLLAGAWARRDSLQLADALYVELAAQLDTVVITTDRRLARATPLAVAPPE